MSFDLNEIPVRLVLNDKIRTFHPKSASSPFKTCQYCIPERLFSIGKYLQHSDSESQLYKVPFLLELSKGHH